MEKLISLYRISIKTQLSYKANFIIEMVVWLFYSLIPLLAINLFLQWNSFSQETVVISNLLYGSIYISYNFARMIGRGFDDFQRLIFTGDLDIFYTRPLPIVSQVLSYSLFLRRISGVLAGVIAILKASTAYGASLIILVLIVVICLTVMYMGLLMISSSIMIVTIKGTMLSSVLVDSSSSLGFYPIDILSSPAKEIFTFVIPIYPCAYLPIKIFIESGDTPYLILLLSTVVSVVVIIIGIVVFNLFLNKYESANG